MANGSVLYWGKVAAACTAILVFSATLWQTAVWFGVAPVLSMELKRVERSSLQRDLPSLQYDRRQLRITRGQLKILPQTMDTVRDIQAYSEEIEVFNEVITEAKERQSILDK